MSAADDGEISEDAFMEAVSAIRFVSPELSPIGAAILAALHFKIANNSRTFARKIGLEHALVLREITALSGEHLGLIEVQTRNARTIRTEIALTVAGRALVERTGKPA
jgi:predicted transcriptional regulator